MSAPRAPREEHDGAADPEHAGANDGAGEGGVLYGVTRAPDAARGARVVWLPDPGPANDEDAVDADAVLAADEEFDAVCDARREAWIESMERDEDDGPSGAETTPSEKRDDDECT